MNDRVSVVGGSEVLIRSDDVDRALQALDPGQHIGRDKRFKCPVYLFARVERQRHRGREIPPLDVGEKRLQNRDGLVDRQPSAGSGEEPKGDQAHRGDWRCGVDPVCDLEGEPWHHEPTLLRGEIDALLEPVCERDRFAESDVDRTIFVSQAADRPDQPRGSLLFLAFSSLLCGIRGDIRDLVVGDRDRDDDNVVDQIA